MRWTGIVAAAALIPAAVCADEMPVRLKEAPGISIVEGRCGACHSLDYIVMNSRFLDGGNWEAEVTKMIKAYGAPIETEDAKAIVDYLKKNYGE
ncbi:MAG TPA: cytochrome c [Methylocella sp.]|nr:cytochrome c [Methylocella sp.]